MDLNLTSCMEGAENDRIQIWTPSDDGVPAQGVLFANISEERLGITYETGIHLDRAQVQRLHNALGEWLYPIGVALPEDRLRSVVQGLAAAILPLSQALGAQTQTVIEPDPEPHDVGHPEHSSAPFCGCIRLGAPIGERCPDCRHWHRVNTRCMHRDGAPRQLVGCECGHRWALHSHDDALGCTCTRCECMRVRP